MSLPTCAKYQLPTSYGCRDIPRTRFSNSRSLRQGQRSNQGQTMPMHTYTPQPMSLPSMNFLHLTVPEIQPGQTISRRPPIQTPWVKTIPRQPLMGCGVKTCINTNKNLHDRENGIIFNFQSARSYQLIKTTTSQGTLVAATDFTTMHHLTNWT